MNSMTTAPSRIHYSLIICLLLFAVDACAQPATPRPREFLPGRLSAVGDLPAGRFRSRLEGLPAAARDRALQVLRKFHFTELDLNSLETDAEGGVFYADVFPPLPAVADGTPERTGSEPGVAQAAVPIAPFPASLAFHSRSGATNVLYINFSGSTVSNTAWNSVVSRTEIPAVPFSTDSDFTTFSDAEQTAIQRVWLRVAEDYAPFDVDVTTEPPATLTARTAVAMITRNTDSNGATNPASSAGGVAYVGVFGDSDYSYHRPAWIYYNKLASSEANIGEAASHEIGHNLGLSHDGKTDGTEYYSGHGSGDISWAPIMGTAYGRNVSQWCKGDYYLANNTQDDLATIASQIPYRSDDHGNTNSNATALVITGGTNIVSTRPDTDPEDRNRANKGILEHNTDVDVFSFTTGDGTVSLTVNPWIQPANTRGGNLDVLLELRNQAGSLVTNNNPSAQTTAPIRTSLPAGTYYLYVRNSGAGTPQASTPTGYSDYGSVGQYFISGYIAPLPPNPPFNLRIADRP